MSLEHLWAGWRAEYVTGATEPAPDGAGEREETGCVFCRILASQASDEDRYVVYAGPQTAVLLNAYPYSPGHVLVLPTRHVADLAELEEGEATALFDTARQAVAAVKAAYQPDGINMGANLGRAAGAGIPDHLHLHVLPRWAGDTNFMTTIAGTRVLPEPLGVSWTKLRKAWPT
ncbi:MAG: hypothetical protein JWM85_88 [Acidimicrobiaceae bacterium]|nr:hypothetical protein [Acidimicrobiaceae bacterium]